MYICACEHACVCSDMTWLSLLARYNAFEQVLVVLNMT